MNQPALSPTPSLTETLRVEDDSSVCKHCGSVLGAEQDSPFCCAGCETVFHLIEARGWQEFYRLRDQAGTMNQDRDLDIPSYAYLNSEAYREQFCQERTQQTYGTVWYLDGLHCAACVWLVEKMMRAHEGIGVMDLNFGESRLSFEFDRESDLQKLAEQLAAAGYRVGLRPHGSELPNEGLLRLGICGALAGNIMLMSLPFYTGLSQGPYAAMFAWMAFALVLPLMGYGARPFFAKAWVGLKSGGVNLDMPIAIGLTSAFVLSTVQLVLGNYHELYFDSMGMLVFFLLTGRYVQRMGVRKAMSETAKLLAGMPQLAEVWRNGRWMPVSADQILVGETLRMRAGDVVPLDGILTSETAVLNLHVVTGESHPVYLKREDKVLAGSVNMGGTMRMKASQTVEDSRFARFQTLADSLTRQKNRDQVFERAARWFLPAALSAALLGLFLWWPVSPGQAFSTALTVLIVVCPCALALAVPTARSLALGRASRAGIWIKSLRVFETLPTVDTVVFDKTGVLTEGKPNIVEEKWFTDRPHWLSAAICELESSVHHPLAGMFRERLEVAKGLRQTIDHIEAVEVRPGIGVRGEVDGVRVSVGSLAGLDGFASEPQVQDFMTREAASFPAGVGIVAVLIDGRPGALFAVEDRVGDEVDGSLSALKRRRLDLTVLSGDRPEAVQKVVDDLPLDRGLGGQMPEDKLRYVVARQSERNRFLMMGDGLNDMGAIAAAEVGVTYGGATDAALKFADVVLRTRDLSRIDYLFDLVETTGKAARRGLALSLGYNLIAVSLSLAGLIGPLTAAILMPLSSLSVVGISAWTFREGGS